MNKIKFKLKKLFKTPAYQSLVLVLGLIFGILISAQWHSMPTRVTNPLAPYLSLKETRDLLQEEQLQLKNEIISSQNKINELQKTLKISSSHKEQLTQLDQQKQLAGLTALKGPGLVITLNDSKQGAVSDESIIHASDLRDTVNLLWGNGAEAISINGERIVTNTSIDCIVNTILINNTRLSTPFIVSVVGDQRSMIQAVRNRDNLSDLYRRKGDHGIVLEIIENNNIELPMFGGSFDIKSGDI